MNSIHFSSTKEDWYTPDYILDLATNIMGEITLDPSSNPYFTTGARHNYTWRDDGLKRDWFGNTFLNPPYGRELSEWTEKHNQQVNNFDQAIMLLPARTDTKWFHDLDIDAFCLLKGRIKFIDGALLDMKVKQMGKWALLNKHLFADNSAPFPSMLTYKGNNVDSFCKAMKDYGKVLLNV